MQWIFISLVVCVVARKCTYYQIFLLALSLAITHEYTSVLHRVYRSVCQSVKCVCEFEFPSPLFDIGSDALHSLLCAQLPPLYCAVNSSEGLRCLFHILIRSVYTSNSMSQNSRWRRCVWQAVCRSSFCGLFSVFFASL